MSDLRFDWDEAKNEGNQRKHGVAFEEAQTVFSDDHLIRIISARKANPEERALYNRRWTR